MKRFEFPLERVREWRAGEVESEKQKLRQLFAERHSIEAAGALLEREHLEAQQKIRSQVLLDSPELRALDAFGRHVRAERMRRAERLEECSRRIEAQRSRLLEARRQCRLLEKMKQRGQEEWSRALARELDDFASEMHLAQWSRAARRSADGISFRLRA